MAKIFKEVLLSDSLYYLNSPDSNACEEFHEAIDVTVNAEELQLLKEQAHEEGYQAGFSQGWAAGQQQGEEQSAAQATLLLQQATALIQAIPEALSNSRLELKTEIADLVLLIVQQFFVNQQQNKSAIEQQITQAINQLNHKQGITLALHPQDLALLQHNKLKIDFSQCKDLRVIPDENLRLGGCLIKSEHGSFDAGIERQIDRLKQVLLQIKAGELHA